MMFNNVAAATNTELYYSCSNYNANGYYSNSMMGHEDVGYYNRRCLSLRTATRNNNDHSSYAPVTQSPLLESLSRSWYNDGQDSEKSKPVCITKISPAPSSDIVTVTDNITTRQTTRNKELLHKPAKTESSTNNKRANRSTGGGRHLQPPSGNNSKLKHECPFDGCPWRFATPYKLRRHIKSHTKETPYQCKECGRGFSVRYNLLMHIQTIHSTPHKYKCPIAGCKDAFHTQPRLNGHLRKIHKKDWKQLQLEQGNAAGSLAKKTSHDQNDTPTELGTVQKWYKCIDCSKEFTSQAKLSAHMKAHSGNFPCTVQGCSRSFQSSDKLSKHLDSSHKSLLCPNVGCNRMFLKQSQLKNHIRIHTNSKYTCARQDCNMKFDNEADYKDHLNIHLGYSIQCPHKQCMLTFPTEKRLELHYRVAHLSNDTDVLSTSQSQSHPSSSNERASFTNGDNFMDTLELPDLKVEDVEAVMSEHTNWTGDQIETFLKSLDIEELDCNSSLKSSLSGYESDSGYSTHEVSPLCVNTRYGSALSPAITPVTPSPILSSPTSLSSPVPLCLYHDEMFPQIHPPTTPSNDQQFFTAANLSLLSQVSQCPTSPDHTFTSGGPALCHNKGTNNLSSFPTSQPTSGQSSKSCVQSVLPPMSNMTSDIEANRHNVTIIPNTYCNSSCITTNDTPTPITMTNMDNNGTNDGSIPPHFDAFLDSYYFNILGTETGAKHSSNITIDDDKYSSGNCEGKDPLDVLQFMDTTTQMCSANDNIGKVGANTENGGVVIAQILSPTKQTTLQKNYRNAAVRSSKGKSKVRHHSASVVMKGHQKGKKKSTWPKSMNSGNLMAFRNFILGKLKTVSPCSFSNTPTTIGIQSTQSLPSTPVTFMPSDDFINDIRFNPDVLLSSEHDSVCFSPFSSCHSGSISPSPVPLSPSLESSMQFTSLSSLTSDTSPCPTSTGGNLGIDGFIHCLSLDPITQGLDQQLSFSQHLSDEFSGILKTDADPLLGGLT